MIILLAGASHSGKTCLAQRLLEELHYPYVSLDHLKMGLIRSGFIQVDVTDDEGLSAILWPISKEMIRTAIENKQNLIVEGCYLPFDWQKDFSETERKQILYCCLIMSEGYLQRSWNDVVRYGDAIEERRDKRIDKKELIGEHQHHLQECQRRQLPYIYIDGKYCVVQKFFQLFPFLKQKDCM